MSLLQSTGDATVCVIDKSIYYRSLLELIVC